MPIYNTFRLSAPYCCSRILSLSYNMGNVCVTQTLMKIIYTCNKIKSFILFFSFVLLSTTVREKSINFELIRTNVALIISNINFISVCRIKTFI